MFRVKTLALLLALCLLAGCGTGAAGSSAPESSSPPPAVTSQPEPAPEPDPVILPQEDPEHPGNLAGAILYYKPGNRLTLYAMAPGTGEIRTVRENDFWNGREVESVSPSGRWLLLSSWDGAPSRKVVALSLYDVERDLLVNLERTDVEAWEGIWSEKHWFSGGSTYRFTDDSTFYYQRICYCQYYDPPHLHRYRIGEDGQVTADFLELECPSWEPGWDSCILLPEEGKILCSLWTGEGRREWLTWELDSGRLLSRTPGDNGGNNGHFDDGVFYYIDSELEKETFRLVAYHMDTDTAEVLASGVIPRTPGMENESWYGRGVLESIWVEELREDGTILLRSAGEEIRYQAASSYREALWDPAAGGDIRFGEHQPAAAFPVDAVRGYSPVFVTAPDGTGLYLPIPQEMADYYQENYGRPYPIAVLDTGELLFLAVGPRKTAPQEDPNHPGRLAESAGGVQHRLTLYALDPAGGQPRTVRSEGFWNGLVLEDVSPTGNRLLLSSREETEWGRGKALSVYDIRENRLYNLTNPVRENAGKNHWFPGEHRYRFIDEESFLYQELSPNGFGSWYALRFVLSGNGAVDQLSQWVDGPERKGGDPLPCVYLPEEQTLACRVAATEGQPEEWFRWRVIPWESWRRNMISGELLSRTAEDPRLEALLKIADQLPEPAAPDIPLPAGLAEARFLAALPTGELLFLAKSTAIS